MGRFELAGSTIPIGDAIIVLRSNGPKATACRVHGATAVVLLAAAALLFTRLARLWSNGRDGCDPHA